MSDQKDLQEIEEFTQEIRVLSLGDLVDKLICLRLEKLSSDHDSNVTEKSKKTLRISALKNEISRRETGKKNEGSFQSGGVSSLGNLF